MNFQLISTISGITLRFTEEGFNQIKMQVVMHPSLSRGITKGYIVYQTHLSTDDAAYFFTAIYDWMREVSDECDFHCGALQICILPSSEGNRNLGINIDDVIQITSTFSDYNLEGVCKVASEYFIRKIGDAPVPQLSLMEYTAN